MANRQTRNLYAVIVVLVALIVIVSSVAGLYYYQYSQVSSENSTYVQQLKSLGVEYTTDIFFGFGNGTSKWYNSTAVPVGSNLYRATVIAVDNNINSTCCEYGSHFVTGIDGVQNTQSVYWWLWTYSPSNSTTPWQTAPVGPDQLPILNDSQIFAWTFCGSTAAGNPTCTPS